MQSCAVMKLMCMCSNLIERVRNLGRRSINLVPDACFFCGQLRFVSFITGVAACLLLKFRRYSCLHQALAELPSLDCCNARWVCRCKTHTCSVIDSCSYVPSIVFPLPSCLVDICGAKWSTWRLAHGDGVPVRVLSMHSLWPGESVSLHVLLV